VVGVAFLVEQVPPADRAAAAGAVLGDYIPRIELVLLEDRDQRARHDVVAAARPERDDPVETLAGILVLRHRRGGEQHACQQGTDEFHENPPLLGR
jgi:hypothetical protein